jgi:hypothetical protein
MKKKYFIGCATLEKQVKNIITKYNLNYDCIFLEKQLHNTPDLLRKILEREINAIEDASEIVIGYGRCGNALIGLKCDKANLKISRYDDCIQMLLWNSTLSKEEQKIRYFGSDGWLLGEEDLGFEFDRMKIRYGRKRALRITKLMFKNYKYLTFIRTNVENEEIYKKRSQLKAEKIGLMYDEVDGDLGALEGLINGEKSGMIIYVNRKEEISEACYQVNCD